ncbi:recombinase family protein [Streptomyces sp. NPDC059352]|uniref:recombinase family protein n=1 Tax=Streptomyces sp. NPDC059352 TaxID=3346810 RepID=UPI0036AD1357
MPVALEYIHLVYPQRMPLRGGLYGRQSDDRTGKAASVAEQFADGRELCEQFGITVVGEFEDPGISASRYGNRNASNPRRASTRTRDDFNALIDTIRAGKIDIVIAFQPNRYYRDLGDYVTLRNACMEADVFLSYSKNVYDLSKPEDRRLTAQDALAAEGEADNIHANAVRTAASYAKEGKPWGPLIFGYQRRYDPDTGDLIGQFLHPVQKAIAIRCWTDVDSGKSTYSVAKWLNDQGPKAQRANGIPWTPEHVKAMLRNPAYIGKRVYHGEVIGDAAWPALLKTDDAKAMFYRVKAKLEDPARRTHREVEVSHLLSRIAFCGECGDHALLTAGKRNQGVQYLNCTVAYDTALREDWMDAWVETEVLTWLARPEARAAFFPQDDNRDERLADARARLKGATEQLAEARKLATERDEDTGQFRLSPVTLAVFETNLTPEIKKDEELIAELTAGVPQTIRELVLASDPWLVWFGDEERNLPGLSLEQKRDVLRKVVTIRLYKASRPGLRTLEPGRIRLSFVGQEGFIKRPITKKAHAQAQQAAAVAELGEASERRRRQRARKV